MKHGKRWLWLLALIPVIVLAVPVLLLCGLIGTRILSAVTGPVNFWNTTAHLPRDIDLVGYYAVANDSRETLEANNHNVVVSSRAGFRLEADRRLEVFNLPAFDGFGKELSCVCNGRGTWRLDQNESEIEIYMDVREIAPATPQSGPVCGPETMSMVVLGRSGPYRFWQYVGDPDSDTGLAFLRK